MNQETFTTNITMASSELLNKIRKDIIGELDAVIQYDEHAQSTNNPYAKKLWEDIRDEEKVHIGELMTLLVYLSPADGEKYKEGEKEFKEIFNIP